MEAGWSVEELGGAKGRGVVARRAFSAGAVVLEDRAYAHAVVGSELGSLCDCCLAHCGQALRCSACKLACYASKEHQARAWRSGHREECAALRACAPHVPPTAVRLALRCALRRWRAQQQQQGQQQEVQLGGELARWEALLQLRHHWDALPEGSKLQFAQMGALAHRLLAAAAPEAAEATGPRDMAVLLARFGANSHTISDDELRPLAVGIFPLGALVNHSCQPNTVHSFAGDRMLFRREAVCPIQPEQEVTTSYTELAATRWERRRELLRHHQFDIDAPAAASGAADAAAAGSGMAAGGGEEGPSSAAAGAATAAAAAAGTPSTAAAAAAAATAAAASSSAALQCLPPQEPVAVAPLAGGDGELRLYSCQLPPWPHDERDAALTAVVGTPGSSDSSGSGWGGMWGTLGQAEHASLASTPATASFEVGEEAAEPSSAAGSDQSAAAPVVHGWSAAAAQEGPSAPHAVQQLAGAYLAALQLQQSLDSMLAAGQAAAAVQQLQGALADVGGRPGGSGAAAGGLALGPRHVLRMRLLSDLHRAAVAAEQWEAALAAAYELLPLYREAYPPVWPQLGLLWAAVAKLEHLQERPHKALAAAEQALHILTTTHGGGGPAADAMRRVLLEARQEAAVRGGGGWRPALGPGAQPDSSDEEP